MNKQFQC
ncbi:hypothetical protein Mgra_00003040 [Meloidogyne graminicola]|nr:hypothetical protein Mgra_00003040 [Meloidogyne graminicola]